MEPSIDGGEPFPVPLHSDFGPSNYRPYVLDLVGAGLLDPGAPNVIALVVLTRQTGLLLALPELALSAEDRESGELASATDLLGPSIIVEVQAAALDEDALQQLPQLIEGKVLKVALVDFSVEVSNFITELVVKEDIAELTPFDFMDFSLVPDPDSLVARAQEWARGGGDVVLERIQYYSADEVPETPAAPPRPATRRRGPGAGTTGGGQPPSRRKPMVASLAESLEAITTTLPAITASLQELRERAEAIEAQRPLDRPSALRRPLGASAMPGSSDLSTPAAQLLKEMPRPKSSASNAKSPHVTFSEGEAQEMSLEIPSEPQDLAKAMLVQSQALTTLVSHLTATSSDPFQDLSSASTSLSTKGAVSRAKLQAELAAQKGTFFVSVLQQMARRMQPAVAAEVEMLTLRNRGVTPTQYLERFGGFGRCRDIGLITWQVALVLNHMMEDNHQAAKDALSLLFVCLEQTAMDNGNMQVGLLLSLTEDPPQALFTNKSVMSAALPRPFAPTAHQRWVTTALQYLKEMDVISTRRSEVVAAQTGAHRTNNSNSSDQPATTAAPKKKQKGKGGGRGQKGQQTSTPQEEEQ